MATSLGLDSRELRQLICLWVEIGDDAIVKALPGLSLCHPGRVVWRPVKEVRPTAAVSLCHLG